VRPQRSYAVQWQGDVPAGDGKSTLGAVGPLRRQHPGHVRPQRSYAVQWQGDVPAGDGKSTLGAVGPLRR
ncbi:hypothetical protein CKW47_21500, partial [Bordetella pertussis]